MVVMKSRLSALMLVIAILYVPILTPVIAQTNHSLVWGVSVGEEFTYVLQREYYSDANNRVLMESQIPFLADVEPGEKVILEISSIGPIISTINETTDLPYSYCNLRNYNDSSLIISDIPNLVLPIGDWDFLTEINNVTETPSLTLVDTDEEWGTIGVGYFGGGDGSTVEVRLEMRYEKENGTLTYLRHRYTTLGTDIIDVVFVHWYPGMPTIIGGDIQLTTLLIIATGGVIGLIVAFIVYRSIKGKKTIAQRLGE
ncbi:MAG: hypothetical protein ACFFEL_02805 [Candidatus Thorarchaeota archaeon]